MIDIETLEQDLTAIEEELSRISELFDEAVDKCRTSRKSTDKLEAALRTAGHPVWWVSYLGKICQAELTSDGRVHMFTPDPETTAAENVQFVKPIYYPSEEEIRQSKALLSIVRLVHPGGGAGQTEVRTELRDDAVEIFVDGESITLYYFNTIWKSTDPVLSGRDLKDCLRAVMLATGDPGQYVEQLRAP